MILSFAEVPSNDIAVMVGAIVTIVGSFLGVAKIMIGYSQKESIANREERTKFAEAVERMALGMEKVADTNRDIATATKRGADEAKERNGHLAELTIQSKNDTLKAIKHLTTQHVDNQVVNNEFVNNKRTNSKE